tara:strand:+ start:1692 stop:2684 length:993 start_codon:yes stop_codon:yes gene_type:complete
MNRKKYLILFIVFFIFCSLDSSTYTYNECVKLTLSPGDYKKWIDDELDLSRYSKLIKKCLDGEIEFAEGVENKNKIDDSITTTTKLSETSSTTTTSTILENNFLYSQNAINAYIEVFTDQLGGMPPKWQKDTVKIYIGGEPSIIQRDTFNYVVGDLNRIIDSVSFELTNSFGDINFYFGDISSMKAAQSLEMKECQSNVLETDYRISFNNYLYDSKSSVDRSTSLVCIYVYSQTEYVSFLQTASEKEIETFAICDIRIMLSQSVFYIEPLLDWKKYGFGVLINHSDCYSYSTSTAFRPLDEELLMLHYDLRLNNLTSINEMLIRVKTLSK